MARIHSGGRILLALVLTGALAHDGLAQNAKSKKTPSVSSPEEEQKHVAKTYALKDLGNDPDLGKWIADTIPEMIKPGSWSSQVTPFGTPLSYGYTSGLGRISHYAPGKVLVIYHDAEVHAQVEAFLQDVKKSLATQAKVPPQKAPGLASGVQPALFSVMEPGKPIADVPGKNASYLVPAPARQPKHLFHFIIRYEGDGLIDANVTELVKSFSGDNSPREDKSDKPKGESSKPSSLSQLFNLILRYEGEGIIDSNVVEVFKVLQGSNGSTLPLDKVFPPSYNVPSTFTTPPRPCCSPPSTELVPPPTAGPNTPSGEALPSPTSGGWSGPSSTPPQPLPYMPPEPRTEEEKHGNQNDRTPILPPIPAGQKPKCAEQPPDRAAILRALPPVKTSVPYLYEVHRDGIEFTVEKLFDQIDPPRFYPLVGPAQLHHCHWKCTVYFDEIVDSSFLFPFRSKQRRVEVVYIDKDHLHLVGSSPEAQ